MATTTPRHAGLSSAVLAASRYAMAAGLAPHIHIGSEGDPVFDGVLSMILNGPAPATPFGEIVIDADTGGLRHATITFGSGGPSSRYTGTREVLAALGALSSR